jgi:ABC-type multidrug transport system fused ATPase/permease subunit
VLLFIDRVLGATAASLLAPPVLSRPVRGLDRSGQRQVSGEARVQAATIQGLPTIAGVIRSIPAGMDTVPNDGAPALSGGHVRCPPIALVLAGRPRMPAMDGATGGLDTGARSIVSRDIDRPCIARAIVVHRLSTAVRSDKIHFLDRGRAAESGDAPSPIAADGRFVGSVKRQTLQGRALFPHLPVLRPDNSPIRKHDA